MKAKDNGDIRKFVVCQNENKWLQFIGKWGHRAYVMFKFDMQEKSSSLSYHWLISPKIWNGVHKLRIEWVTTICSI